MTEPNSLLVFTDDAAMDDFSGGTLSKAISTVGTRVDPKPTPARASAHGSQPAGTFSPKANIERKIPIADTKDPRVIGNAEPNLVISFPVNIELSTIMNVIGKKSVAIL